MSRQDDEKQKKKRVIIVISVLSVFVIAMALAVVMMRPKPKHRTEPLKTITPSATLSQQSWIAKSQAQLERQAREIERLKALERMREKQLERLKQQRARNSNTNNDSSSNNNSNASSIRKKKLVKAIFPHPPVSKPRQPQSHAYVNYPPPPPSFQAQMQGKVGVQQAGNQPPITRRQSQDLIAVALPVHYYPQQTTTNNKHKTATNNIPLPNKHNKLSGSGRSAFTIPPGSFVAAYLLTGADVPTSGHGAVGPIPVVLRVIKDAQMPNLWKANIKSCFMLGQATGSLAAERAYIRVTTLSCINNKGKTIVRSMQGYATGADGKVGLAGRVVSKQGAMLARTLISGFLQGVGSAFQQAQTSISVSPLGSTASVAPNGNTVLRYGIGGGTSKATEMLAKFYMKMANQMFPVIEINAGRKVDVVFLKGVKLP